MLAALTRTAHGVRAPARPLCALWTPALTFWLLLSSFFWPGAHAFVPAVGSDVAMVFTNVTPASTLHLGWLAGSYSFNVSYQLVGANSNGVNKGVFVHFSEDGLTNDTTTTPWIALISCDNNATDASQDYDIFTLAQARGAIAAVVYSLKNQTCIIDPNFADPQNYDGVMDIFTSPSLNVSSTIEYEFSQLGSPVSLSFNTTFLNASAGIVNASLSNGVVTNQDYIFASLTAFNASKTSSSNGTAESTDDGGENPPPSHNSSLAMIILYAITGCVSALFCVVIVSGAVRAIRHPERYGPRAGTGYGTPGTPGYIPAQSRARGLTRAIIETFPIVKFGNAEAGAQAEDAAASGGEAKDLESGARADADAHTTSKSEVGSVDMELRAMPALAMVDTGDSGGVSEEARHGGALEGEGGGEGASASPSGAGLLVPGPRPQRARAAAHANAASMSAMSSDLVPDAIGRETCPICIVDFEEGDELRVLPCEGHHRFHQQCVDPWLLELSSSCPICRQDFHVLETMMSQENDSLEPPPPIGTIGSGMRPLSVASAGARLSRYLRLARHRRRGRERGDGYDPTNPPMPEAPETTL